MADAKRDPARIKYRRRGGPDQPKRPFVELFVTRRGGKILNRLFALVDSGADTSGIPKDLARNIGIDFDESDPKQGDAAGGKEYTYFEQTNQLRIQTEVGPLTLDKADVMSSL